MLHKSMLGTLEAHCYFRSLNHISVSIHFLCRRVKGVFQCVSRQTESEREREREREELQCVFQECVNEREL